MKTIITIIPRDEDLYETLTLSVGPEEEIHEVKREPGGIVIFRSDSYDVIPWSMIAKATWRFEIESDITDDGESSPPAFFFREESDEGI